MSTTTKKKKTNDLSVAKSSVLDARKEASNNLPHKVSYEIAKRRLVCAANGTSF